MKKRRTGKYICFLVMFSMLASLLTGFPVQTASAEGETGLLATDWINWDSEIPEVNPDAEYGKEIWCSLQGITLSLKYTEDGTGNSTTISASQITAIKIKGEEDNFKEDSTATYYENEANHALVDLSFQRCGEYRICYTPEQGDESYVTVYVELPAIGFYKTQTPGEDTFLRELNLADDSNEFYMVLGETENRTLTFNSFEINDDKSLNPEDYLSYEPVSKNVYKITINPYQIYGANNGIDLKAIGTVTENGDTWEDNCFLHIKYDTGKKLEWTDQFTDSWGENGPENISDNAEYQKDSIGLERPYDAWFAFKYGDDMITAEQLAITDVHGNPVEGVHLQNGDKEGIVRMYFPKTGKYILTYKEGDKIAGAIDIWVDLPSLGFYSSKTLSDEGLLFNETSGYSHHYGKFSNRTFYLLYKEQEELTISDVQITTLFRNEEGGFEPKQSDLLSYEPLSNGKGYQITIKENTEETFMMGVTFKKTYTWEDGNSETYDDEAAIFLEPGGEDPKVGEKLVVNGVTYQITLLKSGKKEVSYLSSSKKTAKVTVPNTVTSDGVSYKVTAIADNAFAGNSKLTSIKLSDNIIKIGKSALSRCSKLKKVTVPKNVTEIGKDAFKDCKNLSQITFQGTKIKKIGQNAFKNVSKKVVIKVPKSKKAAYKRLLKKAGYDKAIK